MSFLRDQVLKYHLEKEIDRNFQFRITCKIKIALIFFSRQQNNDPPPLWLKILKNEGFFSYTKQRNSLFFKFFENIRFWPPTSPPHPLSRKDKIWAIFILQPSLSREYFTSAIYIYQVNHTLSTSVFSKKTSSVNFSVFNISSLADCKSESFISMEKISRVGWITFKPLTMLIGMGKEFGLARQLQSRWQKCGSLVIFSSSEILRLKVLKLLNSSKKWN